MRNSTKNKVRIMEMYNNHVKDLEVLGINPIHVYTLYGLEKKAHKMATEECNGEKQYTDEQWNEIEANVRNLFSKYINGLIINHDPRGYTLKIDDSIMRQENYKLYQDWGGYGILCPEFN